MQQWDVLSCRDCQSVPSPPGCLVLRDRLAIIASGRKRRNTGALLLVRFHHSLPATTSQIAAGATPVYAAASRMVGLARESQSVGDSHKGPLNNQGEIRLKPAKNAKHRSTRTPKRTYTAQPRPWWPPRPARTTQRTPLELGPPRSGDRRSLGRGPPRSRPFTPPRAGSASFEGSTPPLERGPPRLRAEHPLGRGPLRSRAPTRASPALPRAPVPARATTLTRGNHAPTLFRQLPGGGHPRRCSALCGKVGVSSVTLCRLPPYD
jgi:hypothetical protein